MNREVDVTEGAAPVWKRVAVPLFCEENPDDLAISVSRLVRRPQNA